MADFLGERGEKFKQENYASRLVNTLNDYRKRKYMCDVVLLCKDREYFAHRSILSAASPYIRECFSDDLTNPSSPGLRLDLTSSIPSSIMEDILQFIYLGEVCVHKENVRELIAASDFLLMTNLKEIVCRFYEKKLCASNCLSISSLAEEFNCVSLKNSADKFVYRHFVSVSQSNEFLALNVNQIIHIISSNDVNVNMEERVFEAVMGWVGHNQFDRHQYIPRLLQHVRLPLINKYYIFDKIVKNDQIMEEESCRNLVLDAINFQTFPDRRFLLDGVPCAARNSFDTTKIVLACGGTQDELSTKETLCYVPSVDFWYPLAPLLNERDKFGAVMCNGYLYAVGGEIDGKKLKSVEFYDFAVDKWTAISNLPEALSSHDVTVLNGEIYVIGGGIQENCSNKVVKYDRTVDKWITVQSLRVPRRGVCVVSHMNLYAIGGYGPDGMALASVERYDPYQDEWAKIFPMNSSRAFASGAVVGNKIFVFGGEYAMWSFYCSGEVFDICTDEWRPIADAGIPRSFTSAVVINREIYVLGGMQSLYSGVDDDEFVDASECADVEVYSVDSDRWRTGHSLPIATSGLKCVAFSTTKHAVEARCCIKLPRHDYDDDDEPGWSAK